MWRFSFLRGGVKDFFQIHSKGIYKHPSYSRNHPEWLFWSCETCLRHIRNHPIIENYFLRLHFRKLPSENREVRFKKVSERVFFSTKIENLQIFFFWSMCRMAMGVGAFDSPDPVAPSRYLKHILLSSRKFFRGLWSRRIHWKMRKSQIKFRNFEMNFWKILKKHVFPNFQADVCVLWTWEWVRLKALIQEHLLDILNIYYV